MRSILLGLLVLCSTPSQLLAQGTQYIPGDLLIMVKPGGSADKVAVDLRTVNGSPTSISVVQEVSKPMRTWLFRFDPTRVGQFDVLRAARSHRDVQLAQNNHQLELRAVPNDTEYGEQWHHQNINSEGAWNVSTGGLTADGDSIVVCIIENADLPHEDLITNAWFNHQEIPDNDVDDDANGYVDDYRGWNPNSGTDQVYGGTHGTEVAGMIGATGNNELGATGANWAVKMMVVFNSGADDAGVLASHSYPLTMRRLYNNTNGEKGAFVVATNASWGINGGQPADAPIWCAMYDSLGAEGVLNCGATANNDVNVDEVGDLPTACPSDFMISVTATDINDERTFSAYGLTTIDVGAPGDDVFTTFIGNEYGTTSGTSFASPLTAGVIGLLYSAPCTSMMALVKADPEQGARYIREKLFEGVDQVGNLPGQTVTGGRINAGTSMELIMAGCGACPAPYNLDVEALSLTSTQLSWQSVPPQTFDLRHRPTGAPSWTEVNDLTGTTYDLVGITPCAPYEFQVRAQCEADSSAYSTLFAWTSEGCCIAPPGLAAGNATDQSVHLTWGSVIAAASYDVRYAPVGSSTFTIVATVSGTALDLAPLEPCTEYTLQIRSVCDGVPTDWSAPITVSTTGCGACTDLPYCTNDGGDSDAEWIANVQLGTINNATGDDGGYGDHTDVFTELGVGMAHAIQLDPDFNGIQFNEWWHVWIDLDQNGTFDNPDELIFNSGNADNEAVEGVVDIPADALLGHTRMRVIMRYNEAPGSPCDGFDYGEVEDYCITLIPNTGQGLHEASGGNELQIHPQPTTTSVSVRTSRPSTNAMLQVIDATGRMVQQQRMVGADIVLGTSHLAPGTYSIVIMDPVEGTAQRGRLVIAAGR